MATALVAELQKIRNKIEAKKEKHKAANPGKRFVWLDSEKAKAVELYNEGKHALSHIAAAYCTDPNTLKAWAGVKGSKQKPKKKRSADWSVAFSRFSRRMKSAIGGITEKVELESAESQWQNVVMGVDKAIAARYDAIEKAAAERLKKQESEAAKKRIKAAKAALAALTPAERAALKV